MNWKQLVTPNLDPVIYQSGRVLTNWLGYCLAYAQSAFSSGWAGATAWDAWASKLALRHSPNEALPSGVYVPVWFSYSANLDGTGVKNWGHVSIYKDGKVWSSPLSRKAAPDVWFSINEVERRYGASYVGWSEDIGGVRVIEQEQGEDVIQDTDAEFNRWVRCANLMRPPRNDPWSREEFRASAVGLTWLRAIEILGDGSDADEALDLKNWGYVAKKDRWDLQIYQLQDQLKANSTLIANLQARTELTDKQQSQVDNLVAENKTLAARALELQRQAESDQATGNAFIRFLGSLFNQSK